MASTDRFSSLPPNIRLLIYEHLMPSLLEAKETHIYKSMTPETPVDSVPYPYRWINHVKWNIAEPATLLTFSGFNRLIRQEILSIATGLSLVFHVGGRWLQGAKQKHFDQPWCSTPLELPMFLWNICGNVMFDIENLGNRWHMANVGQLCRNLDLCIASLALYAKHSRLGEQASSTISVDSECKFYGSKRKKRGSPTEFLATSYAPYDKDSPAIKQVQRQLLSGFARKEIHGADEASKEVEAEPTKFLGDHKLYWYRISRKADSVKVQRLMPPRSRVESIQ